MMKSRLNFLILLPQDIQAGRNILILSPVWFLSERAKLESCQKSTRSNSTYGSEDGTPSPTSTKSHGKWLFKLSRAGGCRPIIRPKKRKRHCFRIQHCKIARSSWSESTKQMNCILSSLLYDDTMGVSILFCGRRISNVNCHFLNANRRIAPASSATHWFELRIILATSWVLFWVFVSCVGTGMKAPPQFFS